MEINNYDELFLSLRKGRENSSKYHRDLAREWLILGESKRLHTPLTYSAFEYRLAIERFIFEFMILIKKEEGITLKDENKTANIKTLIDYIYRLVGGKTKYPKILRFNKIILSFERPVIKLAEPDLQDFYKKWKELSKFCHLLIRPDLSWNDNANFVLNGYDLLNRVRDLFYINTIENVLGWYAVNTIPNIEVIDLRNNFINDKITESAFVTSYNLMQPILKKRKNLRKL